MISKELLQCLNKHLTIDEVVSNDKNKIDNNIYWSVKEINILQSINIYELAHKCKEWAFYAYKISVSSFKSGSFYLKEFNQIKDNSEYWVELDTASIDCKINIDDSGIFKSYSEPEAIFKACEWILKNKELNVN